MARRDPLRDALANWDGHRDHIQVGKPAFWSGKADPGLIADVLGWATMDDALGSATYEPNMVRVVGDHGRVSEDGFVTSVLRGGIMNRDLRVDVVAAELSSGATFTVNGVDRIAEPVRGCREIIEYAVGERAWCNAFVSVTAASAFGVHTDGHDTIVVQGDGSKHWRVLRPGTGAKVFDAVLAPGDVLHVPAGWPHEVTGLGEPSLHWTFGWVRRSDRQVVLDELSRRASRADRALTVDEGAAGWAALVEQARLDARGRSPLRRAGVSLPWRIGAGSWDLDSLVVRWAARLPPVVSRTRDGVVVHTLGRRLELDGRLSPAVDLLQSGAAVPARNLTTADVGGAALLSFLRRALDQDLVLVRSRRYGAPEMRTTT